MPNFSSAQLFCQQCSRLLCMLAALLAGSQTAHAASDLSCTVVGASEIAADGSIVALEGKKNYYETVAGAEFLVQRDTGVMMGRFVSNAGWKLSLIDAGSAQSSYKLLATRPSGRVQSQYFEVRLQDKSEKKPFVLLAAEILHGYCVL